MLIACKVSEQVTGLNPDVYTQLATLLQQYKLPSSLTMHTSKLMDILIMDKKRTDNGVDFIVLDNIGEAHIQAIPFDIISTVLDNFSHAGHH
jgi:3-dehydroquinate synthetase